MKPGSATSAVRIRRSGPGITGAFTLIEMIGVIVVLAILATILVPPLLQRMNREMRESEDARLEAIGDAVRSGIRSSMVIPGPTNFAEYLAPLLGWRVADVLSPARGVRRVLFDDDFRVGTGSGSRPPWTQGAGGSIPPVHARLMVLTSLGSTFPASITNGYLSAAAFEAIWGTDPDTVPGGWTWSGPAADLRIRRVNLTDLFVHVVLNSTSSRTGRYSFNAAFTNWVTGGMLDTWLLKGTRLGLHETNGAVQAVEMLEDSFSRAFAYGTWRSSSPGAAPGWILNNHVRGCDLQAAYDAFIASPLNPRTTTTPTDASNAYIVLMQKYLVFVDSGFSGAAKIDLSTAQNDCKLKMNDLAQ